LEILASVSFVIEENDGRSEIEGVVGLSVRTSEISTDVLGHTVIIFKWLLSNQSKFTIC